MSALCMLDGQKTISTLHLFVQIPVIIDAHPGALVTQ